MTRKPIGVTVVVAAAALTLSAPRGRAADAAAPSFSIIVATAPTGLDMRCPRGCAWTSLSYACGENTPCWATVDERGIEGRTTAGPQAASKRRFRILITVGDAGFSMQCKAGCAWESLSYRCSNTGKCSATVDTTGVRGLEAPTGVTNGNGPVK